jgi:hypothetical protein
MLGRCRQLNHHSAKNYIGRGITVCERWQSFENFLADMGEKPIGKTLDRENNDLGYFKENCRWATPFEQTVNRRSTKLTSDVIARDYEICHQQVCAISKGKSWKGSTITAAFLLDLEEEPCA